MPAYSVSIVKSCARCGRSASREVFNSKNASLGYFCAACAAAEVERLNVDLHLGAP